MDRSALLGRSRLLREMKPEDKMKVVCEHVPSDKLGPGPGARGRFIKVPRTARMSVSQVRSEGSVDGCGQFKIELECGFWPSLHDRFRYRANCHWRRVGLRRAYIAAGGIAARPGRP